jgi:hypothetical protein
VMDGGTLFLVVVGGVLVLAMLISALGGSSGRSRSSGGSWSDGGGWFDGGGGDGGGGGGGD